MTMYQLVLVRHGESEWNKAHRFSGWTDVELTHKGVQDARNMGERLRNQGFYFNRGYTSVLRRASVTLEIILEEVSESYTEIVKDWRLNERHYGTLQGKSKVDIIDELGWQKVHAYRRSYDTLPPLLDVDDERHPQHDPLYENLPFSVLPRGESLENTYHRVIPYFTSSILPSLAQHKNIIVSAHGNTLRVLLKYLDNLSNTEIEGIEFGIGDIIIYTFDEDMKILNKEILSEHDSQYRQDF